MQLQDPDRLGDPAGLDRDQVRSLRPPMRSETVPAGLGVEETVSHPAVVEDLGEILDELSGNSTTAVRSDGRGGGT